MKKPAQVPAGLAEKVALYAQGSKHFVPRLKATAPELKVLQNEMLIPARQEAAEVITQQANDVFTKLGESGDEMPMRLKLFCNGGFATDKKGNDFMAFHTSD